ncbi:MAG: hypothetical protein QNI96_12335 [Woeseiaceae bacterium]|nr:hypothetical protein [Woeseiaceae bacterium]
MTSARRLSVIVVSIAALIVLAYVFGQRDEPDETEVAAPTPISAGVPLAAATASTPTEFPAAELRSALTDVCSNAATDSADREWTQEEIQTQIDAFNEQKQTLSESLSASSSAEHLHVAALLEDDPASRFELLNAAILRNTSDPFLVWGAVQICSEAIEAMPCPLRDWERLLIAVDGQNSESWIRVAANRYAASDYDEALEAMRHASTAAESRAYWTEMIEMIERGFAAGSDFGFPERAGMAFGFAASELPRYGDYVKMCEERSSQSVDWGYACLAYGELVESQGKTEMGVAIARSIQRLALEGLGEAEKAAEVQRRIEARRQERLDSIKDRNPAIERLIFSNPTLFSAYLAAIRSEGEENARHRIGIEIERLLKQQPELACTAEIM